jgi:hypothetical protein
MREIRFLMYDQAIHLEEVTPDGGPCSGSGVLQMDNSAPQLQTDVPDQEPDPFPSGHKRGRSRPSAGYVQRLDLRQGAWK